MAQNRVRVDRGGSTVQPQQANDMVMSMRRYVGLATVGPGIWLSAAILAGVINRTGPVAAFTDTTDTAASILSATPTLSQGDSFDLLVRNTVAQTATIAAGVGIVLGDNVDIAASTVRQYLFTVLAEGITTILQGNTISSNNTITGLTPAAAALVSHGMGVTGTGIPANTTVLGVSSSTGVVTISAVATASGTTGVTFFPRIRMDGVRSSPL